MPDALHCKVGTIWRNWPNPDCRSYALRMRVDSELIGVMRSIDGIESADGEGTYGLGITKAGAFQWPEIHAEVAMLRYVSA